MKKYVKLLVTTAVVLAAVVLVGLKYKDYLANPWTRDGQVRAIVIQLSPRVSGPIVSLPIRDNQLVKAGDLLFQIDPRTYEAAYNEALAKLDGTLDQLAALDKQVEVAQARVAEYGSVIKQAESGLASVRAQLDEDQKQYVRYKALVEKGQIPEARFDVIVKNRDVSAANVAQAESSLVQSKAALVQGQASLASAIATRGALGDDNPQLRAAKAEVETAKLNLEFTSVYAPVDGYITNLQVRLGSQAVSNAPILALIDVSSFWIDAYFRESFVGHIAPGNRVAITLMAYPDTAIAGTVDSVGWGIAKSDGSTGSNLLPNVSPTFQWIRLAQRVPVRVHVGDLPEGVQLRVGTTASVLVMTGTTATDAGTTLPPPIPSVLQ